jgi:Protein of unknown function (DUF3833)
MKQILNVKKALCTIGFVSLIGGISSCNHVAINDYRNNSPKLIPQTFFNGHLTAQGVVKNRSNKVIRYFNADINAYWKNNVGTLEEKFVFDDGEIQYRTWTLTPDKNNPERFTATAGDVVGTGEGLFAGNAINLHYVLAVKYNTSTINVTVNDWMWLINEKTLLNESTMTKFGFKVGSVQIVIQAK